MELINGANAGAEEEEKMKENDMMLLQSPDGEN
jgi:hypothetical protein